MGGRVGRSFAGLCAAACLLGGGYAAAPVHAAPAAVARTSCSAGYVPGTIGGQAKCLRAGEFCTHALDAQYRRYGFRCTTYYANVHRYRLTHG
jgi:hypothetical protein